MPKFWVYASETVFYSGVVEAENETEAYLKATSGEIEFGMADDGENFEVTGVEPMHDWESGIKTYQESYKRGSNA